MATGRVPTTANSPLTTKGDLFTYSTTQARLAAGSDGDTLVADSAATVGLRYQGNYAAGKNKIINGDFSINQRAFSSTTTNAAYGFDRWSLTTSDGTATYSAQTFTTGAAPVSGYEAINFARIVTSGQTAASAETRLTQRIESVRTFAGQTVTVSFWAKAGSGTPKVFIELQQLFGSGGSPSSAVNISLGQVTLSTSWARYSATVAVPSISGKTIGTSGSDSLSLYLWTSAGTDYNSRTGSLGIQSATIDFWGVQVEAGSVATAFQTATGTLQGELEACKRYYERCSYNSGEGAATTFPQSPAPTNNANLPEIMFYYTEKRINPTISVSNGTHFYCQGLNGGTAADTTGFGGTLEGTGKKSSNLFFNMTSWTATNLAFIQIKNSSGWIEASAEL